ncbi:MAG: hypothetical protein WCF93_02260 [Candidatus Moraniibacteriota bacterium]
MKKLILLMSILVFSGYGFCALAMSSANYQINADSINSGGNLSSSSNFKTFDSIGENFTGNMASTNFAVGEGLAPMTTYSLTLALDSSMKNLGTVVAGTPMTATTTASVTTDAWGGYDLYIAQNNDLKHTDGLTMIAPISCSILVPCPWFGTGFGFTVSSGTSVEVKWGTNPSYKYANIPTSLTLFHTKTGYTSGIDNTAVQYKLDVPTVQKAGNYTNILTYTAIAKL